MAALDLEEQEQLDEFKAWWKQYGKWVMVAALAFVLAAGGVQGWRWWSGKQRQEASALFEQAAMAMNRNDTQAVKRISAEIMDKYTATGYAPLAAWMAGRINLDAGDKKSALAQFQFALDHAGDNRIADLARLRLATLKLDSDDAAGALALLEATPADAFAGLFAQLKGDVLLALKRPGEARAAWQQGLEKMDKDDPLRPLVEMKLDGLDPH